MQRKDNNKEIKLIHQIAEFKWGDIFGVINIHNSYIDETIYPGSFRFNLAINKWIDNPSNHPLAGLEGHQNLYNFDFNTFVDAYTLLKYFDSIFGTDELRKQAKEQALEEFSKIWEDEE